MSEDTNNVNLSFAEEDKARIREAELLHDAAMEQLDWEREKYYNSRPKSDEEVRLEYAYKNRVLDRKIAEDKYKRTLGYKAGEVGKVGLGIAAFLYVVKKLFGLAWEDGKK